MQSDFESSQPNAFRQGEASATVVNEKQNAEDTQTKKTEIKVINDLHIVQS